MEQTEHGRYKVHLVSFLHVLHRSIAQRLPLTHSLQPVPTTFSVHVSIMAPTLYSLLALGSLLVSTYCMPAPAGSASRRGGPPECEDGSNQILSTEELQAKQPTLEGLASNSNVTLIHATLGIGHQNYTCNGTEYVQSEPGSGATALLYDITDFLKAHPDHIDTVAEDFKEARYSFIESALTSNLIGNHYFSEDVVPIFNLSKAENAPVLSGVKIGDVPAPDSEDVDWLFLTANPMDGITHDVSEVYRVDTYKGTLDDLTCDDSSPRYKRSAYAAQYWFYL